MNRAHSMIELIGWIATAGTLLSFATKDMFKLRLINGIASIVWIVYAILKGDNPIMVINTCVIVMHVYWFITNKNTNKNKGIQRIKSGHKSIKRGHEWPE